jgi:hypothetical protein
MPKITADLESDLYAYLIADFMGGKRSIDRNG